MFITPFNLYFTIFSCNFAGLLGRLPVFYAFVAIGSLFVFIYCCLQNVSKTSRTLSVLYIPGFKPRPVHSAYRCFRHCFVYMELFWLLHNLIFAWAVDAYVDLIAFYKASLVLMISLFGLLLIASAIIPFNPLSPQFFYWGCRTHLNPIAPLSIVVGLNRGLNAYSCSSYCFLRITFLWHLAGCFPLCVLLRVIYHY